MKCDICFQECVDYEKLINARACRECMGDAWGITSCYITALLSSDVTLYSMNTVYLLPNIETIPHETFKNLGSIYVAFTESTVRDLELSRTKVVVYSKDCKTFVNCTFREVKVRGGYNVIFDHCNLGVTLDYPHKVACFDSTGTFNISCNQLELIRSDVVIMSSGLGRLTALDAHIELIRETSIDVLNLSNSTLEGRVNCVDASLVHSEVCGHFRVDRRGYVKDSQVVVVGRAEWEIDEGGEVTHEPVALCALCKGEIDYGGVDTKKGIAHAECWQRQYYSTKNTRIEGARVKVPMFSFELEMEGEEDDSDYRDLLFDLMERGYVRASDGSVSDEMKSPILRSDRSLLEMKPLLTRACEFVGPGCGTHIHVDISNYNDDGIKLDEWAYEHINMFHIVSEQLRTSAFTEIVWGRFPCGYAGWELGSRYGWMNLDSNHPTIEYRLPKLKSFRQFRRIVWFTRVFTNKLASIRDAKSLPDRYHRGRRHDLVALELKKFYTRFEQFCVRDESLIPSTPLGIISPF